MIAKKILPLCIAATMLVGFTLRDKKDYNIVFIGDSITQAGGVPDNQVNGPAAQTVVNLQNSQRFGNISFSNQGHSGFTTVDFLPATNKAFPGVITAADEFYKNQSAALLFSIMLGTNDSAVKGPNGAPVSAENYYLNLKIITDSLLNRYPACKIIINEPLWYSDNTRNNATYLVEGRNRLLSYVPQIKALIKYYKKTNRGHIFLGDEAGYAYFEKNYLTDMRPQTGPNGTFYLHPNQKGSAVLGKLWADALLKILK